MFEPEGTTTEVIETGDTGFDGSAAGEVTDTGDGAAPVEPTDTVDPWETLKSKGYDPTALEKSHTRFTQELESVKEMERELAPIKELKQMIESDPKVYAALEKALADVENEDETETLRREVDSLKRTISTDKEIDELRKYAAAENLPEVTEREIIEHAIANNLGNLKSAYRDLHFDAIREVERQKALADKAKGESAKAVSGAGGSPTRGAADWSMEAIAALTPEEFDKNRASILAFYEAKRSGK